LNRQLLAQGLEELDEAIRFGFENRVGFEFIEEGLIAAPFVSDVRGQVRICSALS
jgi:hypothetical protein